MMDDEFIYGSITKKNSSDSPNILPKTSSNAPSPNPVESFFSRMFSTGASSPKDQSDANATNKKSGTFWKTQNKVPGTIKQVEQPLFLQNMAVISSVGASKVNSTPGKPEAPRSASADSIKTIDKRASIDSLSSSAENQQKLTIHSHSEPSSPPHSPTTVPNTPFKSPMSPLVNSNGHVRRITNSETKEFESSLTYRAIDENSSPSRLQKFKKLLDENVVDLEALRKLAWQGIPAEVRGLTWKLLLEYYPSNKDRREQIIERKRQEYCDCVPKYFDVEEDTRTNDESVLYRQIQIDVPRTNPNIVLFQSKVFQQALARVLFIWAIRHPASGYVQGINDLATPFFVVFLSEVLENEEILHYDVSNLPTSVLSTVEADTYWCLTKLLDGIQDHYTFAQPGIQRMIHRLSEIIHRVDAPLHEHLKRQDVHFLQFAFRWMNCLLLRELPMSLVIRIWDTYFTEKDGFASFHVYSSAAFLHKFSNDLKQLEFQDIMLFLKNPPTHHWKFQDIDMLLSQAYMWKTLFENSPKHLEDSSSQSL